MRYAIGARILENDGEISDGIFGYSKYGVSCILVSNNLEDEQYYIPVFRELKEAKDFVNALSATYRDKFHRRSKRYNLDISQFRFFLLKVDSNKFTRKLGKLVENKNSKYSSQKFYWVT